MKRLINWTVMLLIAVVMMLMGSPPAHPDAIHGPTLSALAPSPVASHTLLDLTGSISLLGLAGVVEKKAKTKTVRLRRAHLFNGITYMPGDEVEVPDDFPEPDEDVESRASVFAKMTKDELVAEAEKRGLTVTRADGEDGDPVKSDYIAALSA